MGERQTNKWEPAKGEDDGSDEGARRSQYGKGFIEESERLRDSGALESSCWTRR
jgi:hypothetical protein